MTTFPTSPNIGDTFSVNGITYEWDGIKWDIISGSIISNIVQSNNGSVDLSKGKFHKITIDETNANTTVSFSNIPSGSSRWVTRIFIDIPAPTITWPNNIIWEQNIPPSLSLNQSLLIEFYTNDGGTTIYGIEQFNYSSI
jgi:hypothetical protein